MGRSVLKRELVELIKDIRDHFQSVPNVDFFTFEQSGLMERVNDVIKRVKHGEA